MGLQMAGHGRIIEQFQALSAENRHKASLQVKLENLKALYL